MLNDFQVTDDGQVLLRSLLDREQLCGSEEACIFKSTVFFLKKTENHDKIETLNIEKTNYGVPEVSIYFCYLFQSDQEI